MTRPRVFTRQNVLAVAFLATFASGIVLGWCTCPGVMMLMSYDHVESDNLIRLWKAQHFFSDIAREVYVWRLRRDHVPAGR